MPFSDPNEYYRTITAQTGNRADMANKRAQNWFQMMQPWYETLNNFMGQKGAMERQVQQQGYEAPFKERELGISELMAELQGKETGEKVAAGEFERGTKWPTEKAATEADIGYKGKAGAGIMPWEEEAKLRREAELAATRRTEIGAGGKANAENPSEIVWSFLKDNLPVSHSDWVKDAQGNWSLEAVRGDPNKINQVVSEFEGTAGLLYKPDQVKNMSAVLRKILTTGEPTTVVSGEEAKKLSQETGVDQGAAINIIKAAYKVINSPFAATIDLVALGLFTPAAKQKDAARNWLNNYFPGRIGDKLFPTNTPITQPPTNALDDIKNKMLLK